MEQDDAQKLFDKKIILFEEIVHRYETTPKTYKIQTEKSNFQFILIISNGSLDSIGSILISLNSLIPLPKYKLDHSLEIIPFNYIIFNIPIDSIPLSQAMTLSQTDSAIIHLQLGSHLARIHKNIQNDSFGPLQSSHHPDPSYSWQESFTNLLDSLLHTLEHDKHRQLPYQEIRQYLSRAIASFLFDDVDVPSLISFTANEDDIFISLDPPSIVAFVPTLTHAIWGDPLLESLFLPPGPSTAFMEGYIDTAGGPLIVFPRHHTKRLWYTVFLALVVLVEGTDVVWAQDTLNSCLAALKDAPCY